MFRNRIKLVNASREEVEDDHQQQANIDRPEGCFDEPGFPPICFEDQLAAKQYGGQGQVDNKAQYTSPKKVPEIYPNQKEEDFGKTKTL